VVSRELLEACRRRDPRAFEELVDATYRKVFTLALRLLGDRGDAEDVTQETFLRVFRSIRGFREEASFETWLYRIATNTALTHLKRRGRFPEVLAEPQELDDVATEGTDASEQLLERDEIKRALASLSLGLRTVVVLKDVYGLSCREIAAEMGISEGAVKVRLHRARRKLKDEIYGQEETAPNEV
jgi:RNA polymerase sigma-70 factor (ECF subfamily)